MSYKQWQVTDPKILVTNPKVLKIKVIKGLIVNILFFLSDSYVFFFNLGVCCLDLEMVTSPRVGVIPTPRSTSTCGSEDLCCPAGPVSSARKGAFGKTTFTKERARRIHLGRSMCPRESRMLSDPCGTTALSVCLGTLGSAFQC